MRVAKAVMNQHGMALPTVVMILIVTTILGIAAITVTGIENQMAGFARTNEAAMAAAESCMQTAVNVIQLTIQHGAMQSALLSTNGGPVPADNSVTLEREIMGQSDNNPDVAVGTGAVPNLVQANVGTFPPFQVVGDIDRLYVVPRSGSNIAFGAAYEGGAGSSAAAGGVDIIYRITCAGTNAVTGNVSQIATVYACTATGDSCQR